MATYTSNYGWTKPSGSDNVDISVLNDNLDDQDSTIHDAFLNMAPPFSESSTYAVDDIVLYGTGLYKCHTAVVTPGAWTGSTNWQVYKLSEGGSGGGGTSNYNQLTNKPSINSVELSGNKTASDLGLQEELTFDNVPTDGSNNPVKSDGIYDSEKDIYAVMGQMGAKNLIPYPFSSDSYSQRSVDFTCLSDGTITANGTNDGTGNSTFNFQKVFLSKGSYVINGCPIQTSTNYRCGVIRNSDSTTLASDYGSGALFTLDADTEVRFFVQVLSGKAANNIIFKPMLRLASDTDDTYQPYAKTNKELTDGLNAVKAQIPDAPSADGTYNLSVTVANGTSTYSWVSTS